MIFLGNLNRILVLENVIFNYLFDLLSSSRIVL